MAALAIDGTRFYSDRRASQAAADSAALAGAGAAAQSIKNYQPRDFYCGSSLGATATTQAIQAAIQNAAKDGVTLINDTSSTNHVYVTCETDGFSDYLDIHIQVTSETTLRFGQILYNQPLVGVVVAVSRVYPQQSLAYGNAIASLAEDCSDGGIFLDGTSSITIQDGGVFSNSCISGKGHIKLLVSHAEIQYMTNLIDTGGAIFDPVPTQSTKKLPEIKVDPPDCSELEYKGAITSGGEIYPGIYDTIQVNASENLIMHQGLYCVDGVFKANGGGNITGNNVTIYMRSGEIDLLGGSTIVLTAPNCITSLCGVPPAIRGILFYMAPTNTSTIKFAGNSTSDFMGTILALNNEVTIKGTSEQSTMETQIIGKSVTVTGNVKLAVNLSGAELYQIPAYIELIQ